MAAGSNSTNRTDPDSYSNAPIQWSSPRFDAKYFNGESGIGPAQNPKSDGRKEGYSDMPRRRSRKSSILVEIWLEHLPSAIWRLYNGFLQKIIDRGVAGPHHGGRTQAGVPTPLTIHLHGCRRTDLPARCTLLTPFSVVKTTRPTPTRQNSKPSSYEQRTDKGRESAQISRS